MLCRLQHPCIIGFLGVCRFPLCFALELAPLGGLYSLLEESAMHREMIIHTSRPSPPMMDAVLGRRLTLKIAIQVCEAIYFLIVQ